MDVGSIAQWWENTSDDAVSMVVGDVVAPDLPTDG